ncbi:MAG: hypothetical protein OEZ58_08065 [Gammaproteobacteria bacterium]|nr:hypothetical protein [Gammaproteobacteria bacterium]MDH5728932.1 hypothetical protein [Gammaproteobacteria bacterium]
MSAEHDPYTPSWNADVIISGVSDKTKIDHQVIKNAGHFSFLSPFPPQLNKPLFLPASDPAGFDREAFHQQLPKTIHQFLLKT